MDIAKSVGTTSPESARRSNRKYAKANQDVIKARRAVESAKRRGDLKAPAACPKCGRHVKLDFHHTSGTYSEGTKLQGVWRCRQCHSTAETQNGKHERSGKHMQEARKKGEATRKRSN